MRKKAALFFSPEPPFPVIGGGPSRSASVLYWLAQQFDVDVITFWDPAGQDPREAIPPGLVRRCCVIPLALHHRNAAARAWRNLSRAWRGVPSLVDRFAGFEDEVAEFLQGEQYQLAVVEHFWCAPYSPVLRPFCHQLVLDLHNIESVLAERSAKQLDFRAPVHSVFAEAYRRLERQWLSEFDQILVPSSADASRIPGSVVVPNTIPFVELPNPTKKNRIIFSGNLAYEPNRQAVHWFAREVWPNLAQSHSDLEWHLIGKNEWAVQSVVRNLPRVHSSGFVGDALTLIAEAKVAVVPIWAGSGTRIKILEAWAAGTPVVTTRIGAEGLPGVDREHWLESESGAEFLDRIDQVLQNESLADHLSLHGRQLYQNQFTWRSAWTSLDQFLLTK
jgi:polysaccharide biosynthesis protein PslH